MKRFSRRDFLKRLSLGAAGTYVTLNAPPSSGKASAGKAKDGEGTGVIDPPAGPPFRDPVEMANVSTTSGVVEVNIEARPGLVNINGTMANVLTYNGFYPAPTVRVRRGDILKVHFRNSLPPMGDNILGHERETTNLHTHGLHVSPAWKSDNPVLMFMSGDSFGYEYDLARQGPGAFNFYHPYNQGTIAEQYWGGMTGALVVEDEGSLLSGYETHILILKDITLRGGAPEPYTSSAEYLQGKEGDTVMVNGDVNPVLPIRPGQVQRWRILNASNVRFYKLGLENHPLFVIGTDGGLLDKPYPLTSLVLAPGERLDVLIKADQAVKNYRLLSLPYDRGNGSSTGQMTLMTLSYKGAALRDALPAGVNPHAARTSVKPVKTERVVLGIGRGKANINGISFDGATAFTIESEVGTYEAWELVNRTAMDQPFHLHVNPFQVLSLTGGDQVYATFYTRTPAWKDTVIVPRWGSARILVPVSDFPGTAMFNSHIAEHADLGMMGLWDIAERAEDEEAVDEEPEAS